jgi:hypothetical protein
MDLMLNAAVICFALLAPALASPPPLYSAPARYSGDCTMEDTGGKVDGHHIDVYMPSRAEAKKFGRQRVKVSSITAMMQ